MCCSPLAGRSTYSIGSMQTTMVRLTCKSMYACAWHLQTSCCAIRRKMRLHLHKLFRVVLATPLLEVPSGGALLVWLSDHCRPCQDSLHSSVQTNRLRRWGSCQELCWSPSSSAGKCLFQMYCQLLRVAGFMCSHSADTYTVTNIDTPESYTTATSARCSPCALGEFCPEGTYEGSGVNNVQAAAIARRCSPGHSCPSPDVEIECPAGTYCVEGSIEQYSCNFTQLIVQDALATIPVTVPTVLERVYLQGEPLGGNYCPAGSDTPVTQCVTPCRSALVFFGSPAWH